MATSPTMRRYTRLLLHLRTHAGNTSPDIPPCAFGSDEFVDELPPSLTRSTHSHSYPPSRTRRMVSPHPYSSPDLVAPPQQLQRSKSESFRPDAQCRQCRQEIAFPECAAQAHVNRPASVDTRRAALFDTGLESYANGHLRYMIGGMAHPSLDVETEQVMLGRSNSHRPRRSQTINENARETGGFAACPNKANEITTDPESLGWNPYRERLPTANAGAADGRFARIWEKPYILALIFLPVPALLSLIYTAMGHAILRHAHPSQVAFLAPVRSSAAAGAVGGIILALPLEFLIFLLLHSFNISSSPAAPRSAAATTNNAYGRSPPFPFSPSSPSSPSFSEPVIRKCASTPDNFFDDVSSICNKKSRRPHWTHLSLFIILFSFFICIGAMAAPLGVICLDPLPLSFESATEESLLWLLLGLNGVHRILTPSTSAQAGMVGGAVSGLSTIVLYLLWRLTR